MSWQPTTITTIDGRQVLSDSPEWVACCEAVWTLGKSEVERDQWLQKIEQRRGPAGRRALEEELHRVEPAFLLAMDGKETRRAYLAQVEHYRGELVRKDLERRLVALWESRKAAATA